MADAVAVVQRWFVELRQASEGANARFFAERAVLRVNGVGTYRGRRACAGYFSNLHRRYKLDQLQIRDEVYVCCGGEVAHRFEWAAPTVYGRQVDLPFFNRYVIQRGECVEMEQFFDIADRERQFSIENLAPSSQGGELG